MEHGVPTLERSFPLQSAYGHLTAGTRRHDSLGIQPTLLKAFGVQDFYNLLVGSLATWYILRGFHA